MDEDTQDRTRQTCLRFLYPVLHRLALMVYNVARRKCTPPWPHDDAYLISGAFIANLGTYKIEQIRYRVRNVCGAHSIDELDAGAANLDDSMFSDTILGNLAAEVTADGQTQDTAQDTDQVVTAQVTDQQVKEVLESLEGKMYERVGPSGWRVRPCLLHLN